MPKRRASDPVAATLSADVSVTVPLLPPATVLCNALGPHLERCDRRAGHKWLHTWEAYDLAKHWKLKYAGVLLEARDLQCP